LYLPVGDVEICIVKAAAITGEDGGILEQYRLGWGCLVGRWESLWLGLKDHRNQ
jgi:hypothetical protein